MEFSTPISIKSIFLSTPHNLLQLCLMYPAGAHYFDQIFLKRRDVQKVNGVGIVFDIEVQTAVISTQQRFRVLVHVQNGISNSITNAVWIKHLSTVIKTIRHQGNIENENETTNIYNKNYTNTQIHLEFSLKYNSIHLHSYEAPYGYCVDTRLILGKSKTIFNS